MTIYIRKDIEPEILNASSYCSECFLIKPTSKFNRVRNDLSVGRCKACHSNINKMLILRRRVASYPSKYLECLDCDMYFSKNVKDTSKCFHCESSNIAEIE